MTDGNLPLAITVEYSSADALVGELASSGGTFIAIAQELAPGTRARVVVSFPGLLAPIALDGTVRGTRADQPAGRRGACVELDALDRARLTAAFARIRDRDPDIVLPLLRVLIVEDNRQLATLIRTGLRGAARLGLGSAIVFHEAADGHTALELLRHEKFDALIVDIYLPVMDGTHVIAHVRDELGLADLPIIAVSAGGEAAERAALAAGANIFLDKPMRLRQITDAIRHLLPSLARGDHSELVATT